jgi:cell volume regulation protein A
MNAAHEFLLIGGGLGLVAIAAGLFAARIGTPVLLVFLGIGMLAGEDGPGGIRFDDFEATYLAGSVALVIILLEGGLKTSVATIRSVWAPSVALASLGVVLTAGVVGAVAALGYAVPWPLALLLGAIVAPTDAAAVASVLRVARVAVPARVTAVLEVESGLNDPVSVFLAVLLVEVALLPSGAMDAAGLARHAAVLLLTEMGGGAVLGLAGGWLLRRALRRVVATSDLHPVLLLAGGLALFGLAQMLHASGFLAVYLAAVVARAGAGREGDALEHSFESLAWLAQIGLFLLLGLLVTPHNLLPLLSPSLVLALALICVARPLAAVACLRPFGFSWRETAFVGWVGLRGGVPLYLAIIPVLEGVADAERGFAAAFVIVLASLVVQGWTVAPAARLLRLTDTAAVADAA